MEASGQLHASAALPPRKRPQYPMYRRLPGPQNQGYITYLLTHLLTYLLTHSIAQDIV